MLARYGAHLQLCALGGGGAMEIASPKAYSAHVSMFCLVVGDADVSEMHNAYIGMLHLVFGHSGVW